MSNDNHAIDEQAIRTLYNTLLDSWNRRSAHDFAALFTMDGVTVGFDGSQHSGQAEIERQLGGIFAEHPTAEFVGIVRSVRAIGRDAALLRAVAGMVPRGGSQINPAVNVVQSLTASRHDGTWRIELFQNTPAAYHGRPDASAELTRELQEAFDATRS